MVKYQEEVLDRTFAALADPTRRALFARLGDRESLSVSELAQPFSMSLPAIMKHLDVLGDAGRFQARRPSHWVRALDQSWIAQRASEKKVSLTLFPYFWRSDQATPYVSDAIFGVGQFVRQS